MGEVYEAEDLRLGRHADLKRLKRDTSSDRASGGTVPNDLHPLLPGWRDPPAECCGNWSPDGRYFFFLSFTTTLGDVYAVQYRPGPFRKTPLAPVQLTAGPLQFDSVTPAADEGKLFVQVTQRRAQLVRYDAKSKQFVPFLPGFPQLIWLTLRTASGSPTLPFRRVVCGAAAQTDQNDCSLLIHPSEQPSPYGRPTERGSCIKVCWSGEIRKPSPC